MSKSKRMLIDATRKEEVRVAVVENDTLVDFDFENLSRRPLKGNLYLGKIVRIEPSLQAAFVDYGGNRHGFLAFTEIHPDYFRIPVADRPKSEEIEETEALPNDVASIFPENVHDHGEVEATEVLDSLLGHSEPSEAAPAAESQAAEEPRSKPAGGRSNPYRMYKIQEVIHSRQVVLIQVVKEERGNKGAALTTYVSLAGRYCVLMPNAASGGGVSRRITDVADRQRLKSLMQDLGVPDGMSLIVRTAGLDRSKTEIKRDYSYLMKLWSQIREGTLKAIAPSLIYEEGNLLRRAVRDMYTRDIDEVIIEGEDGYKEVKVFMKDMVPSHTKKVQKYKDKDRPLFYQYKIERQIEQMHSMQVQLKSGGYLVISPTEALVSIDVNSGKATRERHIDETALNTNLEAADEVARQVRLRDLAGLIVIDFIDMSDPRHNHQVEKRLKEALTIDRARVQVGRISQFGLLEMSRQRLRPSLVESSTVACPTCSGAGFVRSTESFALQLVRVLEEICLENSDLREMTIHMPAHLAFYLLKEKRHDISSLEERYKLILDLKEDNKIATLGFRIESKGRLLTDGSGLITKLEEVKEPDNTNSKRQKSKSPNSPEKSKPEQKKPTKPNASTPGPRRVEPQPVKEDNAVSTENKVQSSPSDSPNGEQGEGGQKNARKRNRHRNRRRNKGVVTPVVETNEGQGISIQKSTVENVPEELKRTERLDGPSKPAEVGIVSPGNVLDAPSKNKKPKNGWWQRLLDS